MDVIERTADVVFTPLTVGGGVSSPDDVRALLEAGADKVSVNSSAVREWDSNGTNFGYNPARGATRGEFGHNDFYPVAVAAAQMRGLDGRATLRAMIVLDEIRGRLAEVFALKNYKIDHVVHGAIARGVGNGDPIRHEGLEEPAALGPRLLLLELAADGADLLAQLDPQSDRVVPQHFARAALHHLRTDIERDKILTADEAVEYGLIDEVITSRKLSPVGAR